jgi:hypothetical protein
VGLIAVQEFLGARVLDNLSHGLNVIVAAPGEQVFQVVGAPLVIGRAGAPGVAHSHQGYGFGGRCQALDMADCRRSGNIATKQDPIRLMRGGYGAGNPRRRPLGYDPAGE